MSYLVCPGCYNETPETGWLINHGNLRFTVLQAGSLSAGGQHGRVRTLFGAADFSRCPHVAEGLGSAWVPFHKGTTPIYELCSPKDPASKYHHFGH